MTPPLKVTSLFNDPPLKHPSATSFVDIQFHKIYIIYVGLAFRLFFRQICVMLLILVERIRSFFGHLEVTSPLAKPLPPPCHFVSPFGKPPPPLVGGDVLYGRPHTKNK